MSDGAKSSMLMMRQILWVGLAMGPGQQLLIQISNLHIFPIVSANFKPVYYKKHARGQFLCILVSVFFALIKASPVPSVASCHSNAILAAYFSSITFAIKQL